MQNIRTRFIEFTDNFKTVGYLFAEGSSDLILNEDGSYKSTEARIFDECVAGFLPTEVFEAPDEVAADYIEKNLYC